MCMCVDIWIVNDNSLLYDLCPFEFILRTWVSFLSRFSLDLHVSKCCCIVHASFVEIYGEKIVNHIVKYFLFNGWIDGQNM
jgi:hypothetical protein